MISRFNGVHLCFVEVTFFDFRYVLVVYLVATSDSSFKIFFLTVLYSIPFHSSCVHFCKVIFIFAYHEFLYFFISVVLLL
jgi:hypothetical protein